MKESFVKVFEKLHSQMQKLCVTEFEIEITNSEGNSVYNEEYNLINWNHFFTSESIIFEFEDESCIMYEIIKFDDIKDCKIEFTLTKPDKEENENE